MENGGGFMKFGLLLWKNYILQKRHNVQTAFEIILPLFFTVLLVIIRALITSEHIKEPTYYPEFDPSTPLPLDPTDPKFPQPLSARPTAVFGSKYILYSPNTEAFNTLINITLRNEFTNSHKNLSRYTFTGYANEEDLLKDYRENPLFKEPLDSQLAFVPNENPVFSAIIFKTNVTTNDIDYTIRFPAVQHGPKMAGSNDKRWHTELLYSLFQTPGPRQPTSNKTEDLKTEANRLEQYYKARGGSPGYFAQGFLFLQSKLDISIVKYKAEQASKDVSKLNKFVVVLERFPYPSYLNDFFIIALQSQLPLFLVLSFIYSVINISKSVVHEKERRLKESMKMMGLPNWLHWSAWFVKYYVFLLVSAILMTIIYKIPFFGDGIKVISYADGSLLFVFLLCYIFSVITLGFLVSTLFSAANSASTASGVIFFLTYFPYFFLEPRYDELSIGTKMGMGIFSNTAMAFGCRIITMFEGTGAGVKWHTIAQGASPDDNLTLLHVMIMLLVDGVIYFFVAIYIEGVFPGEYGVPMPWYFPFTKWYWCGNSRVEGSESIMVRPANTQNNKNSHLFEKEPNGKAGIKIQGLTKVFGKKVAVNNLRLNFYENQVTALLGHNGAGKTTTMSMIVGLFQPTSGSALVNNYDIRTDIKSVRKSLGLCPQHDVLFDEMTVEEHLRFFCLLKGYDKNLVQSEIDRMLKALNIENKRHAQSQTLSGGMKRKLSVGIALIGGSKVVLMDEPTGGVDPSARRAIWDLISNEKKGRTIVLSTHFMDEADLLGDRIAIMAHGQVVCCGSSLFLKKKYGGGYHLIIVKGSNCQVPLITEILQKRMPEVHIGQNIGAELSYSLPDGKSYMFPDMFRELERRKAELGIDSYGCSITQMEEVFMRVGEQVEEEMNNSNGTTHSPSNGKLNNYQTIDLSMEPNPSAYKSTTSFNLNSQNGNNDCNSGVCLFWQQLRAMLVKKALYSWRNKTLLVVQTIIPVAFLIISLIVVETMPKIGKPKLRDLNLMDYKLLGKPVTTVECAGEIENDVCNIYNGVAGHQSTITDTGSVSFEDYMIKQSDENLPRVTFQYLVGMKANGNQQTTKLTGFFNNQPYHTPPVALNFIYNSILQDIVGNKDLKLSVSNYPLPFTDRDEIENLANAQSEGFQIGFNVSFGMSFLAASFVIFLIKERETKSKHLQYVSGVKFPIFWLAHFIFDAINYIIPCWALMIVLAAFRTEDFSTAMMQGYFLLVLVMYGWSVLPLMYLFSFLFTVPASGYTRMTFFNFISGVATLLAVTILKIPDLDLTHIATALEWPFMFLPNFDVGYSITQLSYNYKLQNLCPRFDKVQLAAMCEMNPDFDCCVNYPVGYLSWKSPGIGRNLFFMLLVGVICHTVLFIIESKIIEKIMYRNESKKYQSGTFERDLTALEDNDVANETTRIRKTNINSLIQSDNMILRDLTKYYDKFLAVDRLCLGIKQGECFGLLGVNGAGKTTTFKMLTGDIAITVGDAYVTNKSVKSEIKEVQKVIGYCPQFDALIPDLTGRETIRLFARLRGIRESEIDALVDRLSADLLFSEHIEKPCGTYSGGNKRKLSTALALIGNPPIVFLDEPTTGMDPVARRHLWNTIIRVRERGTSVILTSHSMEECEALCTRLAIMVNGKFRCLGSTQHLKSKFGDGYTIIAQIESSSNTDDTRKRTRRSLEMGRRQSSFSSQPEHWEQELQPLRNFIERYFRGCQLKDIHPAYVHYHIPEDGAVTWSGMFSKMEEAKTLFNLEAYSVGQTSLEQVFLGFAKGQCNDED